MSPSTAAFLSSTSTTSPENAQVSTKENKIESFRDELNSGPQLGDFIAGVVPRNSEAFADYSGKIKREPGEKDRFVLYFSITLLCGVKLSIPSL